ncbi:MAG: helix-turn-helix transcriptional regulator [Bacillota bacterium]|nr:helix-turn-helix transcriptional regulator [Bacillota bacterium]
MIRNIKRAIVDKGMKYRFVAKETGIPYKSFSAAMNGRRRITVEELVKISQVLEVPVEKLVEGVEE